MSDSSEDEKDSQLPSGDECKRRCDAFANLTGTDSALAMFFLQNVKWDLQAAINYYFEKNSGSPLPPPPAEGELKRKREPEATTADTSQSAKRRSLEPHSLMQKAAKNEDKRIRLLSWNLDGLDTNNLKTRTKFVCEVIVKEIPHVVFLQEVVPDSLIILKKLCPGYRISASGLVGYFTVILLKESDLKFETEDVNPFYSSVMSRSLLHNQCRIKDMPLLLINTHLESMASHSDERKKQLKFSFQKVEEADDCRTVIFGGDLNLRDKDLNEIGGLPQRIIDVWSATGERPEAKFTWDMSRNDNKGYEGKFRPKCRFDRIYLRHPKKGTSMKPVYFELVGLERIPKCQRFASDHWGLLIHFDIQS